MNEYPALTPARLLQLIGFAAVARQLSFTRAARQVGCTPSVLSRRVSALEATMGGPLLLRSTRKVALTTLGETLLRQCDALDGVLAELDTQVRAQRADPAGLIRLHLPTSYGRRCVAPLLAGFMARYPQVRLELRFGDEYSDLIAARADVAVRIGQLADSTLVAAGLRPIRRFACASPAYLADAPPLKRPGDLHRHRCLAFSPLRDGDLWSFGKGRTQRSVRVQPVLRADNAEALHRAALDGAGVALLADFIAADDLASGRLVEVLPDWPLPQPTVQLVWLAGADRVGRNRALIDYLLEHLGRAPDSSRVATSRQTA